MRPPEYSLSISPHSTCRGRILRSHPAPASLQSIVDGPDAGPVALGTTGRLAKDPRIPGSQAPGLPGSRTLYVQFTRASLCVFTVPSDGAGGMDRDPAVEGRGETMNCSKAPLPGHRGETSGVRKGRTPEPLARAHKGPPRSPTHPHSHPWGERTQVPVVRH